MGEAIREYFGHVTDVVKTFWEGLSVTLSYMIRRPITTQYPEERLTLSKRFRGYTMVWDRERCTGCATCAGRTR